MRTLNQTKQTQTSPKAIAAHFAPNSADSAASTIGYEPKVIDGPWRNTPEVLLSVHDDLDSLKLIWSALEANGDCTVFQTFAFLSTWVAHIGRATGAMPCVVVGWDAEDAGAGEGPLFILPLVRQQTAFGTKLIWMGAGVSDYQGPLLSKNFALRVRPGQFKGLWRQIREALPPHDVVELLAMPAKIGTQANPFMELGNTTQHASSAHMTCLKPTWDEFYEAKRSSGSKKRDRQKRRKLDEFGVTEQVVLQDKAEIIETVDTLIAQKSAAFARMGVANMFGKLGMRDFYVALATDDVASGLVEVSRLEVGGQIAAANWGLSFGGRFYYVLTAYDEQSEFAKRGPGIVQLMELMRHATETGHTEFDFTVGDEGYKSDWCEIETLLYDHIEAASVRGLLIRLPRTTFLKVKRFIKQTPVLWQAFTRLRAATGNLPGALAIRA